MASLRKLNKITKAGKKLAKTLERETIARKRGFLRKSFEVKKVISERGRVSFAQAPLVGQPTTPQAFTLESSVISRFKYRVKKRILRIWFQSGYIYDYFDVPLVRVQQLAVAPSKGRYFYYNIRTSFKYTRVK